MTAIAIRPATPADAAGVTACVCEAYIHYIERIGKQPAPMIDDFSKVIAESSVHVAVQAGRIVGALVLVKTAEGFYLDNVAVRPAVKGAGIGRALLELAERQARQQGYPSIYLATHELMWENQELYQRIGYIEYDRRVVNGFARVFFRKTL